MASASASQDDSRGLRPTDPATPEALVSFATDLQIKMSDATSLDSLVLDRRTLDALDNHLRRLPLPSSSSLTVSSRLQLDSTGTALWNACSRLTGLADGKEMEEDKLSLLCRVMTFAFLLLESSASSDGNGGSENIRVLKVALRAARFCLETTQLSLSLKVLEIAAMRVGFLEKACHSIQEDLTQALSAEYYMLRIILSWRQDKPDIAEYMFSKIPESTVKKDPKIAEKLADVCYDIGKWALANRKADLSITWLERAYEANALSIQGLQKLGPDGNDMRLVILHALVRANLDINTEESWSSIGRLLEELNKYGDQVPVLVLQLEVIGKQTNPEYQNYYKILETVIGVADLTEENIKMALHYIQRLKHWSVQLSAEALKKLLQRLALINKEAWLERCFVTLIWMLTTSSSDVQGGLDILNDTIGKFGDYWSKPLSAAASHASLILLWKKIGSAFSQNNFSIAEEWCRSALHSIFQRSGFNNMAKIQRKLILCALGSSNTALARRTFSALPRECQSAPLTTYLMYKLALQDEDLKLGNACLESLCKLDKEGTTYILACVAEAQRSGSTRQGITALQHLLERLDYSPGHGIHLPALLRCTARLIALELRDNEADNPELKEQLCKIFEVAVIQASKHQGFSDGKPFSVFELEWFSRNSYNLALQSYSSWHPGLIIRLLNASIKLTDLYSQDPASERSDASQRRLLCDFLGAVIIVAQARMQNDPSVKTEQYLDVRIYAESFRGRIHSQFNRSDNTRPNSWLKKYRAMISFDFEAAAQLRQWDTLGSLVEETRTIADDRLYAIFADVVLCSEMPVEEATRIFEQIIHAFRTSHSPFLSSLFRERLPRYLRCLFQLALTPTGAEPSTSITDTAVAESVLDQAYVLARDIRHSRNQQPPYPDEELEWLAMMAFNQAVDFYLASADEDCRRWGRKAIELADLMQGDRGAVGRLLRGKFERLWRDG
ncbi:meiosis protein SPO22/ZIP4 like-domain-containing protein [Thermoascus aurantiacus ATCC 26904]